MSRHSSMACALGMLLLPTLASGGDSDRSRPNVLFLAVDDMKDWVNCLGGYEGTVHTPNIDRLAARGMLFTNAHCPSPKCAPSRAAILTGMRPSTSGLYDNGHWWLPNYPEVITLPAYFRKLGYRVEGAGKIFHHTAGNHPPNQWDNFKRLTFRNDPWFRSVKLNYPWSESGAYPNEFPFSGVDGLGHENDWGWLGIADSEYDDALTAGFAVDFLSTYTSEPSQTASRATESNPDVEDAKPFKSQQGRPFFLACGLFRPHLPWYVPKKYFDQYPLDEIVLPVTQENDLNDIPAGGLEFARARRQDLETIRDAGKWTEAIRAYLASITYADAQLGGVLDALDNSPHADNTIIVLWSDHGWHLGEKQHWHKSTLWEEATRVPLVISTPRHQPGVCASPVSLLDLYPTLIELCVADVSESEVSSSSTDATVSAKPDAEGNSQLGPRQSLDGQSLVSLLQDPHAAWNRPAVIEYKRGNVAVRSERYRYIRYRNGGEELYDHRNDPQEWHNLAKLKRVESVKRELAKWMPSNWAESAPTKSAFHFDPNSFTWTNKQTGKTISGNQP